MIGKHPRTPVAKKFKGRTFGRKNFFMATVFWGRKGLLLVKFTHIGETINTEPRCKALVC